MDRVTPLSENVNQLSNEIREKLLSEGRGKAALVLDIGLMAGLEMGQVVTFQEFYEAARAAGINTDARVMRDGLEDDIFIKSVYHSGKRGRPCHIYRFPILSLSQDTRTNDVLTLPDLDSLASYRSALHHKFIERRPGQHARGFLADRLGITRRAVRHIERAGYAGRLMQVIAGIKHIPFYLAEHINLKTGQYHFLIERAGVMRCVPAVLALARKLIKQGWAVTLVQQEFNHYRYMSEEFHKRWRDWLHPLEELPF